MSLFSPTYLIFIVLLATVGLNHSVSANPWLTRVLGKAVKEVIKPNIKKYPRYTLSHDNKRVQRLLQKHPGKIVNIGWKYRGKKHRLTGIRYNRLGFPVFESVYNYRVPRSLWRSSDALQFRAATRSLRARINRNPELKKKFTKKQLQQIMAGKPHIDGLSWHHHENSKVGLQLVDRELHNKTPHTGGRTVWGGGSKHRF